MNTHETTIKHELLIGARRMTVESSLSDEYLSHIATRGFYDKDAAALFERLCPVGGIAVDVGANIGLATMLLSQTCSRVIAYEPMPVTADFLEANVSANSLANVTVRRFAVSNKRQSVEIAARPEFRAGAFICADLGEMMPDHERVTVETVTLDDTLANLPALDFLKIDVEGFEPEVLDGARRIIQRHRPNAFIEVNHWCLNVFRNTPIRQYIDLVLSIFPHVFAVDTEMRALDLNSPRERMVFYHEHVVRMMYGNLVCGFDQAHLSAALAETRRALADPVV
jgi:FkbM family methyltransferase